jgi:hypothetical protein
MEYEPANEDAAAVEHLHPALQEAEEPGAKRQRLHGDATELDGQQQAVGLHPQVIRQFDFAIPALNGQLDAVIIRTQALVLMGDVDAM